MFAVLVGIWFTSCFWFFTSRPPGEPALLMFKRIVNVVEVLALIGAVVFVVLLFANEPDSGGGGGGGGSPGAALFAANCARCHGADGGGGARPAAVGRDGREATSRTIDDADRLRHRRAAAACPRSAVSCHRPQIRQVVEYTRTL